MTHFRILKEIKDRKYNVPLKEIEDVLNKHCIGIEKNKKFIQSAIYRMYNDVFFFHYPTELYANRQQYPVKYWSEHWKALKVLQIYEQNDIAFMPPVQFIAHEGIRKNMTPANISYISYLATLPVKRLTLFFWFIRLPLFLQIILLDDVYCKYVKNSSKVENRGHYLFSLLERLCSDANNYRDITWNGKRITEFQYSLLQKNSVEYHLRFPVYTHFTPDTIPPVFGCNIMQDLMYLRKTNKRNHDKYKNSLDGINSFVTRTTGSLWVEFPEFSFSKNIERLNPLEFPEYPPFVMEDFKNITIKNKLTASVKKSTKIA